MNEPELEDCCLLYCGGSPWTDKGQAISWNWSETPELKESYLKLRREWSRILREFVSENQDVLNKLTTVSPEEQEEITLGWTPSEVEQLEPEPVYIFIDGACSGNPGPGGWGAVIKTGDSVQELSGFDPDTTNNRMELTAAIEALRSVPAQCGPVVIATDSKYVIDGLTQWLPKWKRNGWRTADKKPVRNDDLWRTLDTLCQERKPKWEWVKGHAGHPENEKCDQLAWEAIQKGLSQG